MAPPSEQPCIVSTKTGPQKLTLTLVVLFLVESIGDAHGLGMLIFMAIMMHKAPASIGFGTFLQHHGLKGYDFAKHLLSFTASSPLMNVLLYFGLCASQK